MGLENLEVLKIEELEENLKELKNWITKEERDKFLKHFRNTTGNGELKFKTPKKNDIFNAFKIGKEEDDDIIKPERYLERNLNFYFPICFDKLL